MVNCVQVCYMSLGFNGCFVTGATMFDWLVTTRRILSIAWPTKVRFDWATSYGQ